MNKKSLFLKIFKQAQAKYDNVEKRLAAEEWKEDWQTLIATIYSAQSRDETTIPVMESLFEEFPTLEKLAKAPVMKIEALTKKINYYKTKSKNAKATAQMLLEKHNGKVPETIGELIELPGVGRKTANLALSEIYAKDAICVDTHVHRLSNVLGLVKTKTPAQTEQALMNIVPRRYWSKINRIFVLWGKDVRGRERKKLLKNLKK